MEMKPPKIEPLGTKAAQKVIQIFIVQGAQRGMYGFCSILLIRHIRGYCFLFNWVAGDARVGFSMSSSSILLIRKIRCIRGSISASVLDCGRRPHCVSSVTAEN
jgi:hypothetical protein